VLSTNCVQNISTAVRIFTVQQANTWRHPGLIFVYETSPIFRGVLLNLNLNLNLENCGTLPTSPCFARGPWGKEDEELDELANLREELGEFGDLKVLRGINIQPEKRKPPVKSKEVTLSKFEEEVLSKNPKFAVRSMMSKERFMAEVEKGLCKKQYGDMDKEVVNGVAVEEEPFDAEDERVMKEAEWQTRKSEIPYDFEMKDLDLNEREQEGNPPQVQGCPG
jgi:hypothetical protein